MKVVATKVGYDGRLIRQPGDVFDMPDGMTATWFEPVKPEVREKKVKPADDLV